jgi:ribulose kinase
MYPQRHREKMYSKRHREYSKLHREKMYSKRHREYSKLHQELQRQYQSVQQQESY